jgi:hypothetical protein
MMKEGGLQLTAEVRVQSYTNPITGAVNIVFVNSELPKTVEERLRGFVRTPIKLSAEGTKKAMDKIAKDEAEELWGPIHPGDVTAQD